ncbi:MAG: hypothetical protein ABI693_25780 [Bryobacteraceae bacterium]
MRIALVCLGLVATQTYAQESPAQVLAKCCALSPQHLKELNEGHPVGQLIKFGDDRDIALMGAIRLAIPKEAYLEWWRHVDNYTFSPMVLEAGKFHIPPQTEDMAKLSLDANQIKMLKECEVGKCGFKLSKDEIGKAKAELAWDSPTVNTAAEALAKTVMLQHVISYVEHGDGALPKYNDKEEELDVRATFRSLLDASPYVKEAFPELFAKLSACRGVEESDTKEEMVYWSQERYGFGLKPILNVLHATLNRPSPAVAVIATKQIWASHYYEGSLGLTVLVDAHPGTYLVYLNRSRIDLLKDAGLKRWFVKRFAPGAIRKEVLALKQQVEDSTEAKRYRTQ